MHSTAVIPSGTLVELQQNSVQWGLMRSGKALLKQALVLSRVKLTALELISILYSAIFVQVS